MPNIVKSPIITGGTYQTIGNGGRKFIELTNGWFVMAFQDQNRYTTYFRVSEDRGTNWRDSAYISIGAVHDVSICTIGTKVQVALGVNNGTFRNYFFDASIGSININNASYFYQFPNESVVYNVSMDIKGKLAVISYTSRNGSYSQSTNLKSIIGEVSGDKIVWKTGTDQITRANSSGADWTNPTVTINEDGQPVIGIGFYSGNRNMMYSFILSNGDWKSTIIKEDAQFSQRNCQILFVPKSICGLEKGRVHLVWDGREVNFAGTPIWHSYSDDGGISWSVPIPLSPKDNGAFMTPTITADMNNNIFVTFNKSGDTFLYSNVNKQGVWSGMNVGVNTEMTSESYPMTLVSLDKSVIKPLLIYRNTTGLYFTGEWFNINFKHVSPDNLGIKYNGEDIVQYSISSEGNPIEVVEMLNGNVIGKKSISTEDVQTITIDDLSWNELTYGRYNKVSPTLKADYLGKIKSNLINPNIAYEVLNSNQLYAPTTINLTEFAQSSYTKIAKLDGSVRSVSSVSGSVPQHIFRFNIVEEIESKVGKIPRKTMSEKVQWCRDNVEKITANWWGHGQINKSKEVNFAIYDYANTPSWTRQVKHSNDYVITKLTLDVTIDNTMSIFNSTGYVNFNAYPTSSGEDVSGIIVTDYVEMNVKVKESSLNQLTSNHNKISVKLVSMNNNFSFDKRLASDDSFENVIKATSDANNVSLVAETNLLGKSISDRGIALNGTENIGVLAEKVKELPYASGTYIKDIDMRLTYGMGNGSEVWNNTVNFNVKAVGIDNDNNVYALRNSTTKSIIKYDSRGNEIWSKSEAISLSCMVVDKYDQSVYFGISSNSTSGRTVVKLNKNGDVVWEKSYGTNPWSMILDNDRNLIVSYADTTIYYQKLNQNGEQIWKNNTYAHASYMAVDSNNNIYASITNTGIYKFNGKDGTFMLNQNAYSNVRAITVDYEDNVYVGYTDANIRKFNTSLVGIAYAPNAGLTWAIVGLTCDFSGNVYAICDYNSSGTTTVVKLNSGGAKLWGNSDMFVGSGLALNDNGILACGFNQASGRCTKVIDGASYYKIR